MRTWVLLLMVFIFLSGIILAEPIHVDLDFVRVNYDYNNLYECQFSGYGHDHLYLPKDSETSAEFLIPEDIGAEPLFGTLPLAGKKGNIAFGLALGNNSAWYEELYIDIIEDGYIEKTETFCTKSIELADRDLLSGGSLSSVLSVFLLELPLNRKDSEDITGIIEMHVEDYKDKDRSRERHSSLRICFISGGYQHGTLNIEGEMYDVMLLDLKLNGRFDDYFHEYKMFATSSDGLFITHSEGIEMRQLREPELLGKLRVIGSSIYSVEVSQDGTELILIPSTVPYGYLEINPAVDRIDLYNSFGHFRVTGSGSPVLPAGEYLVKRIDYTDHDSKEKWELQSYLYDIPNTVEVKQNSKIKFPFGAPFTSQVVYQYDWYGHLYMEVFLLGKGGEKYDWKYMIGSDNWKKEVDVIIREKSGWFFRGKVLATVVRIPEKHYLDTYSAPSCIWKGIVPIEGAIAYCDFKLPWECSVKETEIRPDRRRYQ